MRKSGNVILMLLIMAAIAGISVGTSHAQHQSCNKAVQNCN